jgi:hypothetical protein
VDTPPQERLGTGQTTNLINQDVHQFRGCVRPAVGQKPLEMIPDTFVRVEFGSVRRKRNQVQTGRAPQKLPDGIPPMSLAVIQKNDHMTPNLPQQMAKEGRDFFALDIVFIEVTVQSTMKTLPADGDPGDRRDAIVAITMTQDGRLAHGAPRLPDRRDQEEARFVDKNEMGCQPRGFFFTRGQTDRFHSAMATSLRSMARRSGFWWLQPIWWRSLPT